MGGWTPVAEASAWTPVEAPNYEAEAAAHPAVSTTPAPITFDPTYKPRGWEQKPVDAGVFNLFGPNYTQPTTYNEYERESGRDIGTVAGAMAGGSLVPKGWGALGKYLLKPLSAGAGAATGAGAGGATPTEAAEAGASTAAGEGFMGALGAGAKGLLRTGIFGEGLANYFSEATGGKFIPTDELREFQRIHEALGIKPGNMNIGLGATTAEDAWNLPARAIKEAGFKAQDFEGLTPFQQADKLKPVWTKAGQAVASTAEKATKSGVTFDGAKSLTQAIGDMLDPEGSKALKMANETAKEIGIKNWRKMTPTEAVQLKQALWQRLPQRFRGPVYGAITRDLNIAVPDMVGVNRTYTELRSAMDAIQDASEKYMSRASPTWSQQMLEAIRKNPALSGIGGFGSLYSGYEGAKSLYDLMKNRP